MSLELLNNPFTGNFRDWEKPWENGNFQAKFPELPRKQESQKFPDSPVQYQFKQLTTKDIAERDFGGKPMISGKNYEVYTDDKEFIKKGEIEEVQLYSYLYKQTIDGIKVKLFASKNGVLLLQRYLDVIVQPDELVLFLEIKGELDFNTVMHVKAGTDLTHRKDLPFKEIINFSNLHKVEISGAKIKNLIEKEIYKDKHSFMRWFFTITNALAGNLFSFFTKDIVKEGAEGFKTISSNIQEYRLDENRWNPKPKEGEYNPIFIPDEYAKRMEKAYLHQEYDNPNQNVKAQRNIITQISKNFFDELSHAKSFALDTLKDAKQYLPTVLYNKLQSIVRYVFKQIDSIEKAISDPFAALGQLIYKRQKIINAFLCGVYNSIIDIIAGIFSLVTLIFEAVYTVEDIKDQTLIYAEMLVELFENMAEGILNFNFAEFFFNWITFEIKTLFRLINFIEILAETSLEKYAYYYGYIVGIVIDIIVETLLTGGVAAVEKLLQSVEAFLRNPLQKIVNAIEKSAIFVENVLQKIINFLDFLAKKLKKGAEEIFKDVEKIINEIFGFGEEVSDHALTPSEKRYKDKLKAQKERIERKNKKYLPDNVKGNGIYNGKILTKYEIEEWAKILKNKFGTSLKKVESFNDSNILAQFDPNTNTILYKENVTEYLMAHEHYHAEEMYKIGFDEYVKDGHLVGTEVTIPNKIREYKREKYVYEQLKKNARKFNLNTQELNDSFIYFDIITAKLELELKKLNLPFPK